MSNPKTNKPNQISSTSYTYYVDAQGNLYAKTASTPTTPTPQHASPASQHQQPMHLWICCQCHETNPQSSAKCLDAANIGCKHNYVWYDPAEFADFDKGNPCQSCIISGQQPGVGGSGQREGFFHGPRPGRFVEHKLSEADPARVEQQQKKMKKSGEGEKKR